MIPILTYLIILKSKLDKIITNIEKNNVHNKNIFLNLEIEKKDGYNTSERTKNINHILKTENDNFNLVKLDISDEVFQATYILNIKNLNFISLQKNFGSEQIKLNDYDKILADLSNEIDLNNNSVEDTISILSKVNCVVTSDTAIAHLAGVLDVKTYLLLSYNPEWRWYVELKNKCFYPNVNIIQQPTFGDWDSVFNELELKLRENFF